jgi:hypothetical protein
MCAALAAAGLTAGRARAQPGEEPDDPKMSRRLGTREALGPPALPGPVVPPPVAARSAAPTPLASPSPSPSPAPATPPTLAPATPPPTPPTLPAAPPLAAAAAAAPSAPPNDAAAAWWTQAVATGDATPAGLGLYAAPPPPARPQEAPRPRLKLAYRRFDFVRIGASGSGAGTVAGEPFDTLVVDVYPVSSLVRIGLSSQYGWQSGAGLSGGDYFAAESLSAGAQLRGGRVVPFGEAFAGIGYMRRLQFDRTVPTAYWQLGVDAGAEIFLASTGFVSVALGYLRPVNGFAMQQKFGSVFVDTWSFKLGVGL